VEAGPPWLGVLFPARSRSGRVAGVVAASGAVRGGRLVWVIGAVLAAWYALVLVGGQATW
jgi:hypothetical protein